MKNAETLSYELKDEKLPSSDFGLSVQLYLFGLVLWALCFACSLYVIWLCCSVCDVQHDTVEHCDESQNNRQISHRDNTVEPNIRKTLTKWS